ncbi:MAG: hypothetical protein WDN24_17190 [Sphingomonas sp.]
MIAFFALTQTITGAEFGTDRLLFGDSVSHYGARYPGRPGTSSCIILVLLALAGYATREQRWLRGEVSSLLASVALALGVATAALLFFSAFGDAELRRLRSPIPGSLAAISLAIAIIVWNADFGWVRLIASGPRGPAGAALSGAAGAAAAARADPVRSAFRARGAALAAGDAADRRGVQHRHRRCDRLWRGGARLARAGGDDGARRGVRQGHGRAGDP